MNKSLVNSIGLIAIGFALSQGINHFYLIDTSQDYVDKDFALLCSEGSTLNRAIDDESYNFHIKRVEETESKSAPKFTKEDQANSGIIRDINAVCMKKIWASRGNFSKHWSEVSASAKKRLLNYGIKNDGDVLKFLEKIQ